MDSMCPVTDYMTDMFKFALYLLEKAAKSEAEGTLQVQKTKSLGPLSFWMHTTGQVLDDGRFETWRGDVALVKLMERCGTQVGPREFFDADGPAGAAELYGG